MSWHLFIFGIVFISIISVGCGTTAKKISNSSSIDIDTTGLVWLIERGIIVDPTLSASKVNTYIQQHDVR